MASLAEPQLTWTPEMFWRAVEAGVFGDRKVELMEGQLVATMVEEAPHRDAALNIEDALKAILPAAAWFVGREVAVTAGDSVVVPDVMVARGPWKPTYRGRNPRIEELALAIEVADTTLHRDRRVKVPFYLEAGVPVVWVVNVGDARVEVYTPAGGSMSPTVHGIDEAVPVAINGETFGELSVAHCFD